MATKSAPTKSQAVRDYIAEHRSAMPKEIGDALRDQGVDVSRQMISNIKQQMKRKRPGRKPRRGAAKAAGRRRGRKPAAGAGKLEISMLDLLAAKDLAAQLGGVDAAKRAVDVLKKLS